MLVLGVHVWTSFWHCLVHAFGLRVCVSFFNSQAMLLLGVHVWMSFWHYLVHAFGLCMLVSLTVRQRCYWGDEGTGVCMRMYLHVACWLCKWKRAWEHS